MLTTPTTTIQYESPSDDVFKNDMTSNQSPADGFVGLPPPPPPPPAPPVFNNNINNNASNLTKILLPHQEVNLVVNRANVAEIQARSVPTMLMAGSNIWTRRVLSNLAIQQSVFDQHYGESKSALTNHCRRASLTTSFLGGGGGGLGGNNDDGPLSFVLLDATSKMLYDVPMRHLLQLVKKDHDDDASIDHVIRAIDEAHMKSEWLDAVTALNKQFDKRPEDKARVLAHKGSTHGLVLIEQFFVKLVRVPAYEFKLIYLKFCEEAPTQLERMSKHINDLLDAVQVIFDNEQLPGILHVLCLLYNSITGKTIPGLHFDSLLSVLSTRTPKQNTTIAHVLCHLLEEQYPGLLDVFDNQTLLKLKDLASIKYVPIYIDIRLLYTRYKQLNTTLRELQQQLIILPEHIKSTLSDLQVIFTKLFDDENKIKKCEKDLSSYFCTWDLSIEVCFSTLGQFIDKLRLAHMQNVEQRRRHDLLTKQHQQRSYENRLIQTPTTARLIRSSQNQYGSDTNIFRDHLNVPLTPTTQRQRSKVNKISRERFCASSRDVSYTNDDQQEQTEGFLSSSSSSSSSSSTSQSTMRTQNLLANTIPRKRGHSPTIKTVLTKRPFNALSTSTTIQNDQSDDVFISPTSNDQHDDDDNDTKMDCSTTDEINYFNDNDSKTMTNTTINESNNNSVIDKLNDDHILPSNEPSTTRVISVCEVQPSFYLTTPIRQLFDPSVDQSTPNNSNVSTEHKISNCLTTPLSTGYHHLHYSDNEDDNNKENSHYSSALTPMTSTNDYQNTTELSPSTHSVDDDVQQSSSSSLPVNNSNDENSIINTLPFLLSDSETLDEGFETQSNISETIDSIPRSCQIETIAQENDENNTKSMDQILADELSQRLTFNSARRLSHDSNILSKNRKDKLELDGRPISLLKTSASAYSYPTFITNGQQSLQDVLNKRTSSIESLRSMSINNSSLIAMRACRNIQRCAVSRRIWTEKDIDDALKSSNSSSILSSTSMPNSNELDEISSSSTVTTTTNSTTTLNAANNQSTSNKSKNKIRSLQSPNDSTGRTNSPVIRKVSSRLGHASSCQNVSTATSNNTKSSTFAKIRSPPSFFLNSTQIIRSSFNRSTEKPLRAFQMTSNSNNESSSTTNRPTSKIRRLFSSNNEPDTSAVPSSKASRKPPSSWPHQKLLNNKTTLVNILPTSTLSKNRKTSTSTIDLNKTNSINNSVFQRLTQSKRL